MVSTASTGSSEASKPRRIEPRFVERPWGSRDLSPLYPAPDKLIGEVWFDAGLPLLVKFIFTTQPLSVQVHPDDAFARGHENSRGKTEMWHIVKAEPKAQLALGLCRDVHCEDLRAAALSGEIEHMLNWVEVRRGDTFFAPAGTVHAIGSGLTVCEIQQNSDVTYRLYDYGRGRELHLDKGLTVACTTRHEAAPVQFPVECEFFKTEALDLTEAFDFRPDPGRFELVIVLSGSGTLDGQRFEAGETWLVPAGSPGFSITPENVANLLRTFVP